MPCHDSRSDNTDELDRLRDMLTKATRAACDLRTILRRGGTEADLCTDTLNWIAMHDQQDSERIREESERNERAARKRRALAKLDLDDRRILGL